MVVNDTISKVRRRQALPLRVLLAASFATLVTAGHAAGPSRLARGSHVASRHRRARVSREALSYRKLAMKHGKTFNIDPNLILAVIQCESGGDPNCVSSTGAGGLMQLLPSTAADLGVEDRFDPDQNIRGGAQYLSMLINRFQSVSKGLTAYNIGLRHIYDGTYDRNPGVRIYANRVLRNYSYLSGKAFDEDDSELDEDPASGPKSDETPLNLDAMITDIRNVRGGAMEAAIENTLLDQVAEQAARAYIDEATGQLQLVQEWAKAHGYSGPDLKVVVVESQEESDFRAEFAPHDDASCQIVGVAAIKKKDACYWAVVMSSQRSQP
jgi:hypothetical protein